jgi:hypothetical protein
MHAAATKTALTHLNALIFVNMLLPNAQHQPREPAAADARSDTDLNSWLPSAECCGSAFEPSSMLTPP